MEIDRDHNNNRITENWKTILDNVDDEIDDAPESVRAIVMEIFMILSFWVLVC
jgi:hypothetical protein